MSPLDRDRQERVFLEAQELPDEERRAFLDRVCGEDHELREAVEVMLRESASADAYLSDLRERLGLSSLIRQGPGGTPEDAPEEDAVLEEGVAGFCVGPYRLIRTIGRGGSGIVWEAERDDGLYEGRVAVKLLKLSASDQGARRFELEGQYLATLTHPNVAHLLDAGVLPGGQRYLVIELVQGQSIDRYCDSHALTVGQRVELLVDVLAAVSHAHSQLIVHRDIKPSNVLVTDDGMVKLLDFGVAKLLHIEDAEDESITRELGAALTPEFAAPEQLLGGPITTATDVYSLGAVCYLLLTGRNPRGNLQSRSVAELDALPQRDPLQPSRAVVGAGGGDPEELERLALRRSTMPVGLCRALRGDLDNIPVTAQPVTVGYRLGKFVRRHRGSVLAASLMALALVTSTVVTGWQMLEAQRQRVKASVQFLQLLLGEIGPQGQPLAFRSCWIVAWPCWTVSSERTKASSAGRSTRYPHCTRRSARHRPSSGCWNGRRMPRVTCVTTIF